MDSSSNFNILHSVASHAFPTSLSSDPAFSLLQSKSQTIDTIYQCNPSAIGFVST